MRDFFFRTHPWLQILYRQALYHTGDERILLTFDDGPHPHWTPALLEILAAHKLRAFFFLRGDHLREYPQTARMIADAGHWIGLHGMYHKSFCLRTKTSIHKELTTQQQLFAECGLPPAVYWRPPYGYCLRACKQAVQHLCLTTMLWNLAINDYRPTKPEVLLTKLLSCQQPGDIILLHDYAVGTPQLLAMLPEYLETSHKRNLRFVSQGEEL